MKQAIDFAGKVRPCSETNLDTEDHEVEKDSSSTLKTEQTKDDVESQSANNVEEPAKATVVVDLDVYEGETLEEKVDSFIDTHPIIMFSKSWCLFSIDAQNFLIYNMKVDVHVIEVDSHPQGREIMKHVQAKTKHDTVPVIFVRGEFLGGFEEVNAHYADGTLQREYLQGLTQADKCDEFITKSKVGTQPLFWFPDTVNAHVIRVTGVLTSLTSAVSAISLIWGDWGQYLAYALFLDFVLRLFAGSKLSLYGRLGTVLASPLEPKPRHGRPKQFATMCGCMFSGLGSLFFLLSFPYHGYVGAAFMGGLAVASGMEGFLDFCLGCVFFRIGIQIGVIPK